MNRLLLLSLLTLLISFSSNLIWAQQGFLSLSGGISKYMNFETIGEQKIQGSGSLSFSTMFDISNDKFSPLAKLRMNFTAISREITQVNEEVFITNLSSFDVLGGVEANFNDTFYPSLAIGPSLLMQARDTKSDINYLEARLFRQVALNSNLELRYDLSDWFSIGLSENYNITGLQKEYESVNDVGEIITIDPGLNVLTSELSIHFKL